jgi:hypothetical protein
MPPFCGESTAAQEYIAGCDSLVCGTLTVRGGALEGSLTYYTPETGPLSPETFTCHR